MQCFVRFHPPYVVSVQQPVELLCGERDRGLLQVPRPVKFMPLQVFVPDDKAVLFPHQQLQLVYKTSGFLREKIAKTAFFGQTLISGRRCGMPLGDYALYRNRPKQARIK